MKWVLAVLLLCAASGAQGWRMGHGAAETEAALALSAARAEAFRAAQLAGRAEIARLVAAAERDQLAQALEDAAHADPDADSVVLRADSVRRIARR
ncbi:hypothetical protein [Falsirhodobacter deserti]|uniref:hypothetical protein n=1 Tax=Falsirhodobacter deserti TaxID=1365611 RepID=UPI000FE35038|nr:hypothetical protein [Falsirhodobacter deserti]